jgi:hypothetical protein
VRDTFRLPSRATVWPVMVVANVRSMRTPRSARQASTDWTDRVEWKDDRGQLHSEIASDRLTAGALSGLSRFRTGNNYKYRQHFEGFYWFSQLDEHVWHESMLERDVLLYLDFATRATSVDSQPFQLDFIDGSVHVPDYLFVAEDGTQTVIDVRPLDRVDELFLAKAANTRRVCDAVGWTYEIHTGQPRAAIENQRFLAGYRFPDQSPSPQTAERILAAVGRGAALSDVVDEVAQRGRGEMVPYVYSLMWAREIRFDQRVPLSWATKLKGSQHDNTDA